MLRSCLHHNLAQRGTTGEEYEVEAVGEQSLIYLTIAQHDGDVLRVEDLLNHLLEHLRYGRDVGRGLQHGSASCGYCTYERIQQQLHGIVPRCHDERVAQWLTHDIASRGEHLDRSGLALAAAPLGDIADMIGNLTLHDAQLGEICLFVRLVKIGP